MRSLCLTAFGFALVTGSTLLSGCSGDIPSSISGTLSIRSPADKAIVSLPADKKISVTFDTNYVLKDPGTCGGQSGCGSVYLLVDGTACNAPGKAWNANATSSPTSVDLALCNTAVGVHTISAELHQDGGTFVENSVTKDPVTSSVTVTVQQ